MYVPKVRNGGGEGAKKRYAGLLIKDGKEGGLKVAAVIMKELNDKSIGSQIHYVPLYKHNYIKQKFSLSITGNYSGSENYFSQIMLLQKHLYHFLMLN